jgi:hypothetical protein
MTSPTVLITVFYRQYMLESAIPTVQDTQTVLRQIAHALDFSTAALASLTTPNYSLPTPNVDNTNANEQNTPPIARWLPSTE